MHFLLRWSDLLFSLFRHFFYIRTHLSETCCFLSSLIRQLLIPRRKKRISINFVDWDILTNKTCFSNFTKISIFYWMSYCILATKAVIYLAWVTKNIFFIFFKNCKILQMYFVILIQKPKLWAMLYGVLCVKWKQSRQY